MMASESRIVVEYEEKEFGVVLPVQALFLDKVKEMVTEKLKTMYHGFDKVKAGDLTFYSDFERTDEITDEKMPAGERFYANLAAPISPISSDASISSSDEPHPKRLKRWNQINQVLLAKKKAGSSRESIPYSSTSWSDVSPIFLPTKMQYIQVVQDIPSDDFEVLVTMLTWIFRCFGHSLFQLQNKNETQRLHLIAPVLWSVVQLLPDIKVDVECVLDGKRVFAHGRFEFILTRQVRGVTKRICIVEVKHDDFEQGLAQNLLGCEVAADVDNIHEVYGIVTNFEKWMFVKDRDEEIACDEFNFVGFDGEGVPVRDQLRKIVGKIHGLLQ